MSEGGAMQIPAIPAKRRQILTGARQVFAELGFERASVDLIAARAGVSKATVYNHFEDKKALFVAAVVQECDDLRAGLERCLERPVGAAEQGLQLLGEKVMAVSLAPPIAALYRQAVAEAARLPEIGRMLFERVTLRIEDPRSAAIAFVALCQGDLAIRSRLGILEYPVDEQIRETVKRAVAIFVAAHRA